MAVDDLPLPVVNLLNALGIPWPYVNEDSVSEFASLARRFGQAVQATHDEGTRHMAGLAEAYKSASSEKMLSGWQKMSETHVAEIVDGCAVLADALDLAAGYIVGQKLEALAQLVEMAVEFFADQAASVATLGIAEAALPLIEAATVKLMDSLVMDLQQYILGKVTEAALKPLMAKVEAALSGLDWSQAGGSPSGKGTGFELNAAVARAHAQAMGAYAEEMRSHAQTFGSAIKGLSF